jgi:CheY-like chemotaxis protein/HPt (histidine-containing phosphotransfer) domain-containing protein
LRVLVVDDVLMNRDVAGSFLRAAGHDVTYAEGGSEAIAAVADSDFDVVLMDVRMPGIDGLEATRRIRALADPRGRVPIVAMTAQGFREQVAECLKAGMDLHLAKPFEMAALLSAVAHAAAVRPERRPSPVAAQPVIFAAPAPDPELPVLDPRMLEQTAAHLTPAAVATYMQAIAEHGETLLCGLREPDALARSGDALAELAHKLAGSAGLLGFTRLAAAGGKFEQAVLSDSADTAALADSLSAAIDATCREIHLRYARPETRSRWAETAAKVPVISAR